MAKILQGIATCIRERRMPYGYHLFKQAVKRFYRRIVPFRFHYFVSLALFRMSGSPRASSKAYDLVFVMKKESGGWILEGICREIARFFPGRTEFHYLSSSKTLPDSHAYFFSHYSLFPKALRRNPILWGRKNLVFYTHPKESEACEAAELLYALSRSTYVVCQGSKSAAQLAKLGVPREKCTYVLGGADEEFFPAHDRTGRGHVGFCTAYYPRKAPDRILEIVKAMPHRKFILLGPPAADAGSRHRRWDRYERFRELVTQPNLTYAEAPYAEYPHFYAKMDVFVSASILEGGPIPLIEAMMSNVVPVASRTGFSEDIVRHGDNGFLFPVDAPVSEICALIEKAFALDADVRSDALGLSWRNYSLAIQKLLGYPQKHERRASSSPEPSTNSRLVVSV